MRFDLDLDLERFEKDGFLVVPGFVPIGTCDALIARAKAIVDAFLPASVAAGNAVFTTNDQVRRSDAYFLSSGDQVRCFFEEEALGKNGELLVDKSESINKIGHALHDRDPVFESFSKSETVSAVIAALNLKKPALVQSMYIFKNPRIGGDVSCHQDSTFLHTEPLSVVGLWFALEDATIANGCMWALPGGHRGPLRKRFARGGRGSESSNDSAVPARENERARGGRGSESSNDSAVPARENERARGGRGSESSNDSAVPARENERARDKSGEGTVMHELASDEPPLPIPAPSDPWIPLEAKRGTMIVLHGQLPHWSSANRSAQSRHAFALHFVDDACTWSADNWLARAV